jgi:biopolymer transport protein ExbD
VDSNGDIFYNKNKVPLERAARVAEAAKKEAPQANVVVQMDRESNAWATGQLIDELRSLLTSPPCLSTDDEA